MPLKAYSIQFLKLYSEAIVVAILPFLFVIMNQVSFGSGFLFSFLLITKKAIA